MNSMSEKKQNQINMIKLASIKEGELIHVKKNKISSVAFNTYENKTELCVVIRVIEHDSLFEVTTVNSKNRVYSISIDDIVSKDLFKVGANPFPSKFDNIRPIAYTLSSILFSLDILGEKSAARGEKYIMSNTVVENCNWNPYVYDKKGEKKYYQRPLVWSLKDKQLLIESIYQGIDCGKVLIRERSWEDLEKMAANGETELAFKDIVDGKQRLDAVRGFTLNEYPDLNGNYFGDLSAYSQHLFDNHQLFSYAEMPANTTDEEVLSQFLKLNFTGVPQSIEHIELVKSLRNNL